AAPAAPAAETPAAPQVILTPAQTEHILKELEKVEAQIGQGRNAILGAALTKFRAAMSSESDALALYLDCYKLENFERKDLKQTDFTDWRDNNEARLKDDNFRQGLVLQLEYLVLTIQAQDIDDPKKMGPLVAVLQTFLGKAIVAVQATMKHTATGAVEIKDAGKGGGQGAGRGGPGRGGQGGGGQGGGGPLAGILRQSVKGTEFSKAYLLDDYLDRKEWEYSPLNVDGIYSNAIFPYYLAEKPAELPAQWDARINAELALRKTGLSETEFNLFLKEEHPRLLWSKSSYLLSNNINAVNALADMLKIIQTNPNHPDAAGWLKEFKEIVKKVAPAGAVETPISK
ncbi:MAG: hypothetical protein ACKVY0_24550, partial [Prosthecobacter sp.]|uniref:hypothetical protein n=1 Tax=Prosthecobacter sp. TaxID=1965333 RepID=UPI003902EF36